MVSTPAEELKCQIGFLEKLHILAQTESLALDESDWAKLDFVVSAKQTLVAQITEQEKQIALSRAAAPHTGPEWPALERRAAQLLDLIRQVDESNRTRLEHLRAASQSLQAYGPSGPAGSSFSKFAE
jgi:flagellar biosynthesis/type III secretory pathway chaperone